MIFSTSIKHNYEFRRIYGKGKSASSPLMAVYCRRNRIGGGRYGFTVGSRIGKAVVRNRVRRRLKEIYRTNEEKLKSGYDIIVVARARAVQAGYSDLEKDYLRLCSGLGLLREKEAAAE